MPDLEDVTWETILEEPFVLAVPARHPLANAESISLKKCAQEPFVSVHQRWRRTSTP
ncbi:LysR substrate-binding domain-containing protein [Cupriavidus basilensis]